MAQGKKSFVLYTDLIHTVKILNNNKAGILFKHILSYCNDENPESDDILLLTLFEPIKQQLKRDLRKYEEKRKKLSAAGKRSAAVRNERKNEQMLNDVEPALTNSTVNVNDNDNVIQLDIKQIDKFILELKTQEQFLEGLYMTFKLKNKIIGKLALKFREHLKMFPKTYDNFLEFRNHFGSWVRFKITKGELGEFLKHQKGEL